MSIQPSDLDGRIVDLVQEHWGKHGMPFLWKNKADVARLPSNDLLGRLLLSLEPDELRRISMPLDVVSKLRRQSL